MELRRLGTSGLIVSALGLGGNTFGNTADADATSAIINRAVDLGINFIDTADSYSGGRSEELVGRVLAQHRQRVVLATKVGWAAPEGLPAGRLSRRWIMQAAEASLRRLNTDYIDLYQVHRPDDDTPLEETLRALDDLVAQGKVRYTGCSNYSAWQLVHALGISRQIGVSSWITTQPRWNLIDGLSDPHLLPACRTFGVGMIPYTPLASGILTGKYRLGEEPPPGTRAADSAVVRERLSDAKIAAVERLRPWAEARGRSTAELGLAWLMSHPEVSTIIVGARSASQLDLHMRALDFSLSLEERSEVERLVKNVEGTTDSQ
jgi:aryl-alcohol dehydrogenase-like predicted oxidoreductase